MLSRRSKQPQSLIWPRLGLLLAFIAVAAFTVLKFTDLVSIDGEVYLGGVLASLTVTLIILSWHIDTLARYRRSDLNTIRLASDRLNSRINTLSNEMSRLLEEREEEGLTEVEVLHTPYAFYRALNAARERSTNHVRVMKLHHKGPQDHLADYEDTQVMDRADQDETAAELHAWYDGLKEWNLLPDRMVERIMTCPSGSKSMKKFRHQAAESMRETQYQQYILPWDGEQPLVNMCIFDDREVLITLSTGADENPYLPIPGIRIHSKEVADFFQVRYYEKMKEYCKKQTKK